MTADATRPGRVADTSQDAARRLCAAGTDAVRGASFKQPRPPPPAISSDHLRKIVAVKLWERGGRFLGNPTRERDPARFLWRHNRNRCIRMVHALLWRSNPERVHVEVGRASEFGVGRIQVNLDFHVYHHRG